MNDSTEAYIAFTGTLENGDSGLFVVAPDRVVDLEVRRIRLGDPPGRPPGASMPLAVDGAGRLVATELYRTGDTTAEKIVRFRPGESHVEVLRDAQDYMIRGVATNLEGTRLALAVCKASGDPVQLMLIDESGEERVVAGLDDVWNVAMSPDGSVVYCEAVVEGTSDTYRVPWDTPVAEPAFAAGPDGKRFGCTVSPCGRYLAVNNFRGEAHGIQVVDADGQHARRISFDGDVEKRPCWSPDGEYVAVVVGPPPPLGMQGIALLSADGSESIATLLPPGWCCDSHPGVGVDSIAWWAPERGSLDLADDLAAAGERARMLFLDAQIDQALEVQGHAPRETPRGLLQRAGLLKALARHVEAIRTADAALQALRSPLDRQDAHELKKWGLDQLDDVEGALAATRADEQDLDWPDARCFRHAVRAYLQRQLAIRALETSRFADAHRLTDDIRSDLAAARRDVNPDEPFTQGLIEEQTHILDTVLDPALAGIPRPPQRSSTPRSSTPPSRPRPSPSAPRQEHRPPPADQGGNRLTFWVAVIVTVVMAGILILMLRGSGGS